MSNLGCGKKTGWVKCGDYYGGEMVLCERCERKAHRAFPQGWRY